MNVRSLAEAVSSQYCSILDSRLNHSENVDTHLRKLVSLVTYQILQEGTASIHDASTTASPVVGDHNFVALLSDRSMSRLDAFLGGCELALADDESRRLDLVSKDENKSKSTQFRPAIFMKSKSEARVHAQTNNEFHVISLVSALSGFSVDDSSSSASKLGSRMLPQINPNDLIIRLELYFSCLRRVYEVRMKKNENPSRSSKGNASKRGGGETSDGECVFQMEQTRAIEARVFLLIKSFLASASSISSMRHILTNLLTYLTKELLAVPILSDSLKKNIKDLVLAYEHLTCFASLAFLSTPQESAERKLAPLLYKYLHYLQENWKDCVASCQLELFLSSSIDCQLRNVFKNIEFQSLGHLLEVCYLNKARLENIILADVGSSWMNDVSSKTPMLSFAVRNKIDLHFNDDGKVRIKQALRDLRRETIIVNGHILPPVNSVKDLVKILRETLNSRTIKLSSKKVGAPRRNVATKYAHTTQIIADNDVIEESSTDSTNTYTDEGEYNISTSSDTDFLSSGNEGDAEKSYCPEQSKDASNITYENGTGNTSLQGKKRRSSIDAIDVMTRRLLVAACRTGVGGDAYFVVRDLFGDDTVDIVPASESSTSGMFGPMYIECKNIARGSIELVVRLSTVLIKVHASFDVYPKKMPGECDPLIQLHTTTTEAIFLQEVRIEDKLRSDTSTRVMLKEKEMPKGSSQRTLSIRPARYERVKELRTPS